MSVQLHPDIEQLDRSSLCYSIYSQLYHNFFNAQQKKDAEHPYGVEEGDETSVRLKNTAYGFASAIAGAVTGEGGESGGGLLIDYLKKTGGDMTGIFRANYGFEAGVANTRILETYSEDITDADGNVTEDTVINALEKEISQKFGDYVKLNVDGTDGSKKLSLSVNFNGESGHDLKIVGSNASFLGFEPGSSTRISTSSKLSELGLTGDNFSFQINGEKFTFTKDNTVADVISAVNKSDAGVRLSYSSISDSFSMETTEFGSGYNINITETEGGFLSNSEEYAVAEMSAAMIRVFYCKAQCLML